MHRQFGLIGKKLGHSFSKKHFSKKFADKEIDASYELYELAAISEFPALLQRVPGLKGLNVTIPYKSAIIPYLDRLSPEAEAVRAVNTITIRPDGLVGNNTDVFGFWASLQELIGATAIIPAALILGTGGAAKAVAYVLQHKLGIKTYLFVSRNPRIQGCIAYEEVADLDLNAYPLIINTTPVGMYPHIRDAPDFPYHKLNPRHYAIDLIYNPEETQFLKLSKAQGAQTENGMPMLIRQAEKSWEIWNG